MNLIFSPIHIQSHISACIYSRLSRFSTARGPCTGLVTVGPTKLPEKGKLCPLENPRKRLSTMLFFLKVRNNTIKFTVHTPCHSVQTYSVIIIYFIITIIKYSQCCKFLRPSPPKWRKNGESEKCKNGASKKNGAKFNFAKNEL